MAQAAKENDYVEEPTGEEKPTAKEPAAVKENEEDGSVTVEPEEKPTRKERRGGRQADEVARWRQKSEDLERQLSETRQQTAAEFQRIHQRIQQHGQGGDPIKSQLANIRAEQESIQGQFRAGNIDTATAERLRARFYELDEQAAETREQRILQRVDQRVQQASQQTAGQGEEAIIRAEFPEVIGNQAALRFAMGEYYKLTGKGEPGTLATTRKAMNEALKEFGLRPQAMPAVSQAQQQRFGAIPAQAGYNTSGGEIRLEGSQRKMAEARWPDVEPHEAYRRMAALLRAAQTQPTQDE